MILFEKVTKDIYLLKVPFGNAWTGITLLDGQKRILIDSGAREADIDEYLVPALKEMGLTIGNIDYLTNTHSHGDHIGGYRRIKELHPDITVAASETDYQNVEDPVSLAVRTRTAFPEFSPTPQSYLKGIAVDVIVKDAGSLTDHVSLVTTPGHDKGCVCWYERNTKTIITGDSLQCNGTPSQGIGFYQSLHAYRDSLRKLMAMDIENILCGHAYDGIGYWIQGKEECRNALKLCLDKTGQYQEYVDRCVEAGITSPGVIAKKMIQEIGCGMPDYLFMAVFTVTEHLKESRSKETWKEKMYL